MHHAHKETSKLLQRCHSFCTSFGQLCCRCRLIPFADSQSLMRKNCKLASALQPQGNLDGCAVLILLNDIAVSDTKEKLTLEGAAPGSQEFW